MTMENGEQRSARYLYKKDLVAAERWRIQSLIGLRAFYEAPDDAMFMTEQEYKQTRATWRPYVGPHSTYNESDWRTAAACAETDPGLFHPKIGESITDARRICMGCVVRKHCLDDALAQPEQHGFAGGKSASERRRLKRQAS